MICTVRIIRTYIIAIAVSKNVVGGKLTNFIFCRRLLGGERGGGRGEGGGYFFLLLATLAAVFQSPAGGWGASFYFSFTAAWCGVSHARHYHNFTTYLVPGIAGTPTSRQAEAQAGSQTLHRPGNQTSVVRHVQAQVQTSGYYR